MVNELIPATIAMPAHYHVGMTPGGSAWNIFPGQKTPSQIEGAIEGMKKRLDTMWAAHDAKVITVPKLTNNSASRIDEEACVFENPAELKEDYANLVMGATFARGTRRLFRAVAEGLEYQIDDVGRCAAEGVFKDNAAQIDFAERTARRSMMVLIVRLQDAVDGRKPRRRVSIPLNRVGLESDSRFNLDRLFKQLGFRRALG